MSVAIDRQGFIYAGASGGFGRGHISKFNPSFHEILRIFTARRKLGLHPARLHRRSLGRGIRDLRSRRAATSSGIEADQFSTNLKTNGIGQTEEAVEGELSLFAHEPLLTTIAFEHEFRGMDVEPNTDDLYVDRQSAIEPYSPALPGDPSHPLTPPFGSLINSWAVAAPADGKVLALNEANEEVNVYAKGDTLPNVTTNPPNIPDIGHEGAVLTGRIDPAGGDPITECRLEYGTEFENYESGSVPCSPDPSGSNFTTPTDVSATLSGLTIDQPYHYRFVGANAHGEAFGGDQVVSPVAVLDVEAQEATGVDQNNATLHGVLNPDGMEHDLSLRVRAHHRLPAEHAGTGSGIGLERRPGSGDGLGPAAGQALPLPARRDERTGDDLQPRQDVQDRQQAAGRRGAGERTVADRRHADTRGSTRRTRPPPTTSSTGRPPPTAPASRRPTSRSGRMTPNTKSRFPSPICSRESPTTSRSWRQTNGAPAKATTRPSASRHPACPNAHVREQTGSNFLPDCRAYELVSPEKQGAAVFWPSNETIDFGEGFGLQTELDVSEVPQNTGYATNPSRFTFEGGLGAVPGLDVPNSLLDTYLATRTNSGWVTTFPGIKGSETLYTGRRMCSESLDICIDHVVQDQLGGAWPSEDAPYVFNANGDKVGRWPTNVNAIEGGATFFGDQQPSADFTHFVFSSRDLAFAPGGLTSTPGSAYDNDTVNRTVTIISKQPNGENLPKDGGNQFEVITFPANGVSKDGSHILMQTAGHDGAYNLYMRVNDSITYEVSRNHGVNYIGMTKDGSKVLFSAVQQIVPSEDHDTSLDIYEWDEQGDTVKLLSTGNGNGNSDECNSELRQPVRRGTARHRTQRKGRLRPVRPRRRPVHPAGDRQPARDRKRRRLLLLAGEPRPVEAGRPQRAQPLPLPQRRRSISSRPSTPERRSTRIQISPDGLHAAFVTAARLTGYDNHGFKEMYTYNAATEAIRCASCNPSGAAPTVNVQASQGGPFMSDDGRAFFATREALVPQDTDGIIDVYEFVDGRPQLITTGTGTRDFGAPGAGPDLLRARAHRPRGGQPRRHRRLLLDLRHAGQAGPQRQRHQVLRRQDQRRLRASTAAGALRSGRRVPRDGQHSGNRPAAADRSRPRRRQQPA